MKQDGWEDEIIMGKAILKLNNYDKFYFVENQQII